MSGLEFALAVVIITLGYKLIETFLKGYFRMKNAAPKPGDSEEVERLYHVANKLSDRIQKLETILDKDLPGWRSRS